MRQLMNSLRANIIQYLAKNPHSSIREIHNALGEIYHLSIGGIIPIVDRLVEKGILIENNRNYSIEPKFLTFLNDIGLPLSFLGKTILPVNPMFKDYSYLTDDFANIEFELNRKDYNGNTCFVLLPFKDDFFELFEDFIKPVVEEAGFKCITGANLFGSHSIMRDVWNYILHCKFVIADLTERNPNVFYEVGISHTIGRETILISQSIDDVPFDLQHLRTILYDFTPRGCSKLRKELSKTIETITGNVSKSE
jgi:DNA-binding Lrp family transcriptional regulator